MIYIIAEIGVNHNGSLLRALQLIHEAKEAGADAVKFQAFIPELLVSPDASRVPYQGKGNQLEMMKRLAFSRYQFEYCKDLADREGIDFFASVFDVESMKLVEGLQNTWKVPSGEITNLDLLDAINERHNPSMQTGEPVILSTGMADLTEIESAMKRLWRCSCVLTLLHCVSLYPCPPEELNLSGMTNLSERFRVPIGLSDHTQGITAPILSVAYGATMIEKHFTMDTADEGPDHAASIDPVEFRRMVEMVRVAESMIGLGGKRIGEKEMEMRELVRRGEKSGLRGGG